VTEESVPQWLGMEVETSTPQAAEQLDADYQPGVLVIAVEPGSPAYEKGIRPGMVIGEIDHQKIATRQDYSRIVSTLAERKKAVSLLVYDQQGNTGYIAIRPESN
jgi:serine protease Do